MNNTGAEQPVHLRRLVCTFVVCIHVTKAGLPGRIAQSATCLATDARLTADPGVASSIPAQSHTFMEIDHEIISTVILLSSPESFKKGFCQLQAKVYARSTTWLTACFSLLRKKCG